MANNCFCTLSVALKVETNRVHTQEELEFGHKRLAYFKMCAGSATPTQYDWEDDDQFNKRVKEWALFSLQAFVPMPDYLDSANKLPKAEEHRKEAAAHKNAWMNENWGTYYLDDVTLEEDYDDLCYRFVSPWREPLELIKTISSRFPQLQFILFFEIIEEKINRGCYIVNGKVETIERK